MRILRTGDPCPCCGQPIQLTEPDALRLLAMTADLLGLPDDVPPALTHRCEGCSYGKWQTGEHIYYLGCCHDLYYGKWVGAIRACPMDTEGVRE